jgi:HTH-type transcriptional regulator/antitoxin HigA
MKVIRDEKSYDASLARVNELAVLDPDSESAEGEELQILSILIEDYESRAHNIGNPTPLEAIKFRMEQAGLNQRDLIPFIGSKSKTSEVLAGKRPLSLPMVRSLSEGLGIPAEVLIQEDARAAEPALDLAKFPVSEAQKRNWFPSVASDDLGNEVVSILDSFGGGELLLAARTSAHVRSGRDMDASSLMTWAAWSIRKAESSPPLPSFKTDRIDAAFLAAVCKLSANDSGPIDARAYLAEAGIALVVVEHLPRTYLDGALIFGKYPVIALTLRHDRLDSFWFTLLHELAHLVQVCQSGELRYFFDDLDVSSAVTAEVEADKLASETLVPEAEWLASPASKLRSPEAAVHLAKRLGIHPAIVAGRIRHATGDYRKLSRMLGQGQVRQLLAGSSR